MPIAAIGYSMDNIFLLLLPISKSQMLIRSGTKQGPRAGCCGGGAAVVARGPNPRDFPSGRRLWIRWRRRTEGRYPMLFWWCNLSYLRYRIRICYQGKSQLQLFVTFFNDFVKFENSIEMSTAPDAAAAWPTTATRWPSSSAAAGRTQLRRRSGT